MPDDIVMSDGMAEPPRSDPYEWHAYQANRLLRIVGHRDEDWESWGALILAEAQVHATLAHAAATRLLGPQILRERRPLDYR